MNDEVLNQINQNVYQITEVIPDTKPIVGHDFKELNTQDQVDFNKLFSSYDTCGIQATNLHTASNIINKALELRYEQAIKEGVKSDTQFTHDYKQEFYKTNFFEELEQIQPAVTMFLGFTSNMLSSGVRESIKFLVKNKMVDVLVTTTGAIEEDCIKCFHDFQKGDFHMSGETLRKTSTNRIGNILVPNKNQVWFEEFLTNIITEINADPQLSKVQFTPSKLIEQMGMKVAHEDSVLQWAYKNKIPIFCPSLTDGAVGDVLFTQSQKGNILRLDITEDIRRMNSIAMRAKKSAALILGGGMVKHHIMNANLFRNGVDLCVQINTGNEQEASDSGAPTEEAVSWGKIGLKAEAVKVWCEASIAFPILVSQSFAKKFVQIRKHDQSCK